MKRLRGPQLKMPDLSVPPVLANLYYDLLDRRLLPLVALVVVAIAAVPFLLGGGSQDAPTPLSEEPIAGTSALEAAGLTVVEATPGLRDYRKRLARRERTDPFKQRFTHTSLKGAQLNPQTETTTTTAGSGEGAEPGGVDGGSSPPSTVPPGTSPPSGGDGEPTVTFFAFAVNVRIGKSGGEGADSGEKQDPVVKERVLPLTPLPGEKAPVVTYMGISKKTKPLLMVSTDVKSVFGETKCVSGDDACQLLEVEPGFPVTFVYGYGEVRYTINVLKVYPVVTGHA